MGRSADVAALEECQGRIVGHDQDCNPSHGIQHLLGSGLARRRDWAVQVNRRWLVNLVALFAGIHFYTQWFERLGATPLSVLLGGVVMLASAFALWMFNRRVVDA